MAVHHQDNSYLTQTCEEIKQYKLSTDLRQDINSKTKRQIADAEIMTGLKSFNQRLSKTNNLKERELKRTMLLNKTNQLVLERI